MKLFKIENEKTFKVKVYAFFQFVSFSSYIFFMLSIGLMGYFLMVHGGMINDTNAWWAEMLDIMKGTNNDILSSSATIIFYIGVTTLGIGYVIGFSIIKAKKRNLYDSLFILFIIIPFISNLFAIMAQISSKEIRFVKANINKKALIDAEFKKLEETRLVALAEIQKSNEVLAKMQKDNAKKEEIKLAMVAKLKEKAKADKAKSSKNKKAVTTKKK